MSPLRVVLIGGSGFLGSGLAERLVGGGHEVTIVGRGPVPADGEYAYVRWDAKTLGDWVQALDGADVIVHLAGKRVDCRPTQSNIEELISSREDTVLLVGRAVEGLEDPPDAWVQLSSLAIFGDSGDEIIDESASIPASGLTQQVEVCRRWEAAFAQASASIDRTVLVRPAVAIGDADPASTQLALLARWGLGGNVGSGEQWVSWISTKDLFDLLELTVTDASMDGLYHLTSPNPVRNRELMSAYRAAVGRRLGLPSPAIITKVGAWLIGSDPALALTGRRCVPGRLLEEGYRFEIPEIEPAVSLALASETAE